jgi:tRNA pseudouridine38-40 synthase
LIEIDITANAFLYHMVRNIAGSLIPVGRGQQAPEWIAEVLQCRDRDVAGKTAAPEGLSYIGPRYPGSYGFPKLPLAAFPADMVATET